MLRRAIAVAETIERLEGELAVLLGKAAPAVETLGAPSGKVRATRSARNVRGGRNRIAVEPSAPKVEKVPKVSKAPKRTPKGKAPVALRSRKARSKKR